MERLPTELFAKLKELRKTFCRYANNFFSQQINLAGVDAALIILAISTGAAMPNIFASRQFERRRLEEQERLLNEEYKTDL